jgi:hypothetical protein
MSTASPGHWSHDQLHWYDVLLGAGLIALPFAVLVIWATA